MLEGGGKFSAGTRSSRFLSTLHLCVGVRASEASILARMTGGQKNDARV